MSSSLLIMRRASWSVAVGTRVRPFWEAGVSSDRMRASMLAKVGLGLRHINTRSKSKWCCSILSSVSGSKGLASPVTPKVPLFW